MKAKRVNSHIGEAIAIGALCLAVGTCPARGATLLVTNTNDSGDGSLRQAILTSNLSTNVLDFIHFSISGPGPHTITPLTPLPTVTDPVTIDGYSQSGASANTLPAGDNAVLQIIVLESLVLDTTNSTVRGLATRQIQVGALPGPKGSNVIEGCFIGLDATGTNSLASPGFGVFVQTPNNRVGGATPAARNLISGEGTTGIEIFEAFATGNVVQGNFIGTDRTGTQAIGNTDRAVVVNMNASGNTIGGALPGAGNVISGNLNRGITLDGANNVVQGNFIGTDVTGRQPLGNARTGVEIGGPGNLVGGTNSGAGNVIAFNGVNGNGFTTNGVDVKLGASGYAILGNSIFDNAGLGIDVNANGLITPGFPVLTLASNTTTATLIRGTHTPSLTFRLELFTNPTCDPSGNGEGKTLLTSTNITTDGAGNFTVKWPAPLLPGLFLTATASGATEFSPCRMVVAAGGTNSWTNSVSGKWEDAANWSLRVAPFIGHARVLVTNAASKTVLNDAATAATFPSTLTISNLLLSAPAGATNTLLLSHAGTATPLRVLKDLTLTRGGSLVISNAALRMEGPVGTGLRVDGAVTLASGLLVATNNSTQTLIGDTNRGALTVSDGTLLAYYPIVGANAGADGTWHIAGGTNIVTTTFDIADDLTATGAVVMTGGQLTAPNVYIGLFGHGRMTVSNGMFQCAGQGLVGSQPGAQGNFTAAGGTSTFGNMLIRENASATGAVLVTGTALVQINGPLDNRGGNVTVAGGSLQVLGEFDSVAAGNSVLVTGGQFTVTNDNSFLTNVTVNNGAFLARDVFLGNQRLGVFRVAGGLVALPGSFNGFSVGVNGGTGVVWQTGGQILLTNTALNVGGLFSPATGQMTISNGTTQARQVFVGGQGGGNGTVTLAGGTLIASNLEVNATSQLVFNQGTLQTRTAAVANNAPFVVGNGMSPAVYHLLGGTNAFAKGLRIASNAMLTGNGTIAANVTNSGVIAPGASAGRIDINGQLVLTNSSELRLELGGYAQGSQFDFLNVAGSVMLGGTLSVSLIDQFQSVMTNGASFTVLTAGSLLTGAFANVASGGSLTTTDGYARFTVLYAGATALRLTGLVIVDSDNDNMPDWWEDQFGLHKNSPADAALDLDGDGASNVDEFRAGTLPNNPNSVFRIVALQRETGNLRLTWTTVGGKSYRVQTNAPSASGSFTNNFADLSPLITVPGTGESTTNIVHTGAATNAPARYYRVRLGP
jgi:hypothetical protein